MTFARPELLWLALLLPALVALGVLGHALRRRRLVRALGDADLVRRLGAGDLERFVWDRLLLVAGAAAALGAAAADPRWGIRVAEERSSSTDIVVAADVSRSMFAADIAPNRLEQQRILIRRLLREFAGDRIGLVAFAGRAYTLAPLTVDHSALQLYIDALDPDIVSQGGTTVSLALRQAVDLVRGAGSAAGDRVVVLITDGESHEDRARIDAEADRAARAGVRVYTVGMGSPQGAPVPLRDAVTGEFRGYTRDERGEVVISRLDENVLRDVAGRTGGAYVRFDQPGAAARLIGHLQGLDRVVGPSGRRIEEQERYGWFVALALLLLAADQLRHGRGRAVRWHRARREPDAGLARSPAAGRPAAAAVLLVAAVSLGFGIGDLERGNRLYRAGRYAEAVEAYRSAVRSGRATPELHYNLGTALLRLGRHAEAEQSLRRALEGVDPVLRQHAFYNMGGRFLDEARSGAAPQDAARLLESAIDAYKRALRLDPGDADAKWNLELALRERERQPEPPPQSGGESERERDRQPDPSVGQGGGGGGAGRDEEDRGQAAGQAGGGMSREQAEQILNAVEQDERRLTQDRLRRGQRRTPVLRDW